MKLGLLAKKKEEEEKRLCEKKRGPEASLNTQEGKEIMKFLKYPYNKLRGITFFPPYKNSSSNFTNKSKEIQVQ